MTIETFKLIGVCIILRFGSTGNLCVGKVKREKIEDIRMEENNVYKEEKYYI